MSAQAPTLLLTKLNRPPLAADRVDRPRLIEMLDRGLPGPLTLVSAAADPHVAGTEFTRLVANAGLVEPLTGRELDVLALLRERLSDKEIAHKLSLSPATVKRHTANLYGKLGVNKRRDAAIKAEAPGILPPR
jgi:ATP/maltotriose-dependent transcriptional regulator MalT